MIQYQKGNLYAKFEPPMTSLINNVIFGKYCSDVKGVEINFFNNLPIGQVKLYIYLPEEISTCPKKIGTMSFEAVYLWKKLYNVLLGKNIAT